MTVFVADNFRSYFDHRKLKLQMVDLNLKDAPLRLRCALEDVSDLAGGMAGSGYWEAEEGARSRARWRCGGAGGWGWADIVDII